jgi:hypothetical protein
MLNCNRAELIEKMKQEIIDIRKRNNCGAPSGWVEYHWETGCIVMDIDHWAHLPKIYKKKLEKIEKLGEVRFS